MKDRMRMPRLLLAASLSLAVWHVHAGQFYVAATSPPDASGIAGAPADKAGSNDAPTEKAKGTGKIIYGRLAIGGDKLIAVNGNTVRSGATIINGALLETPAGTGASVQLWPLGRLEISPETRLQLTFAAGRIDVDLLSGCLVLMTYAGVRGAIKTPQGTTERSGPAARDFIDVCTGEPGAFAPVVGQGAATKTSLDGFNPLFLFGAVPAGVAAGIYAGRCHGRPPVASPCGGCCCCC